MQSDVDFLGLVADDVPGHFHFDVVDRLTRLDGGMYGGTANAVAIATAELVTGQSAVWMTTQFVSSPAADARVGVTVDVLAAGRRTTQVRVTATIFSDGDDDGVVAFAALGATGAHSEAGLTGEFERLPTVSPPEESQRWNTPMDGMTAALGLAPDDFPAPPSGFTHAMELRGAEIFEHPDPGPGRVCAWVRRSDGYPMTPALVAFVADLVPMGVAHALGVLARGTSLDNTIRMGELVDTDWVLLDLRPHLAAGGYGHGIAHVWSRDGHLIATASQTASMKAVPLAEVAAQLEALHARPQ